MAHKRKSKHKVRDDRKLPSDETLRYLKQNMTYRAIGKLYGVSGVAVYWALHPAKHRINAHHKANQEEERL